VTAGWPDVLAAALVGTARTGGQPDALLDTVAALALRRRAGVALVAAAWPVPPAPVDPTGTVSPAAATRAGDLLTLGAPRDLHAGHNAAARLELLAEWLAATAATGRRLPAELAPALLDAAHRHRELRPHVEPVAGPLAGWLAAQRPEWAYAATTPPAEPSGSTVDDGEVWELGALRQRVAHLHRLRGRDPAAARQLLLAGWDAEPPEDRAELLATLSTGLSAADEALLELALDDRRRQVRDTALDLLARLPGSAHAARMAQRATACLAMRGAGPIEVSPPAACDRSMRRDGVAARPPAGTGERAWWLEEILVRTPLALWGEPRAFLARGMRDGWAVPILRGLTRAAVAQRDGGWAAALIDPLLAGVTAGGRADDRRLLAALYGLLPAGNLAARAAAALSRGLAGAVTAGADHALRLCPRPWPPAVADAVFAALDEHLGHGGTGWEVAGLCELAGLRLPASAAPRALALLDRVHGGLHAPTGLAAAEQLARTLRFRHDMLQELA
jgi:hypothetical protein